MSTLICDFEPAGAGAAALAREYVELRAAGEALVLWRRTAPAPVDAAFEVIHGAAALDRVSEDERIPVVGGVTARLPDWLDLTDFSRVLVMSRAAAGREGNQARGDSAHTWPAAETACLEQLFAAGCEAVELLAPGDAVDLAQSWYSGRRVGLRLFA